MIKELFTTDINDSKGNSFKTTFKVDDTLLCDIFVVLNDDFNSNNNLSNDAVFLKNCNKALVSDGYLGDELFVEDANSKWISLDGAIQGNTLENYFLSKGLKIPHIEVNKIISKINNYEKIVESIVQLDSLVVNFLSGQDYDIKEKAFEELFKAKDISLYLKNYLDAKESNEIIQLIKKIKIDFIEIETNGLFEEISSCKYNDNNLDFVKKIINYFNIMPK